MHKKDMRPRAPQPRSTEQRLFKYALTAGAGMLAASTPAEAAPIYIDAPDQVYTDTGFSLDLNSDSVTDVSFTNTLNGNSRRLDAIAPGGVVGTAVLFGPDKAAALSPSVTVGPGNAFYGTAKLAYAYAGGYGFVYGNWANVTDRYLGLRFLIGPNTHYGWVRMDVSAAWSPSPTISATVKDWAYESDPDTPIHAGGEIPEPGTLSLVALGAAGLAAWRRRTRRDA